MIAFENKVTKEFLNKVIKICDNLGFDPNYLMACMNFETGGTFEPFIENAYSHAVGLIQFMASTAAGLDTTLEELKNMTSLEQLDYVEKYFLPVKNKLHTLEDVYMAILWPAAIGKDNNYVLFDENDLKHPKRYYQNKGLDFNKDGKITKAEAAEKVRERMIKWFTQNKIDTEQEAKIRGLDIIK